MGPCSDPPLSDEAFRHAIFPCQPFGPVPDPVDADQWNRIYFLFAMATFWAQAYEDGMVRFVKRAEARWRRSRKTAHQIDQMTMGALQREYQRYVHLEDHHLERMKFLRNSRNGLAHNFYRRRMKQLASREGRSGVIEELQRAMDLFQTERDEVYWCYSLLTGATPL